jgi:hypothetical protein
MKMVAIGLGLIVLLTGGSAMSAEPNSLTPEEKAAGWRLLFDGKTLDGWRGFKTEAPDAGWHVKDGALGPDPKRSRDIMTKAHFDNFELTFEWKISPKGNSGVMYRVIEDGGQTYHSGPEYQVLDNSRGEPPLERAGALYGLYAPTVDATKPVGEYNQGRIVVDGSKVEHWLNGQKVVEADLASDDFKTRVAGTKFKAWPQFAASPEGHIALQNHGDEVAYRNIKIRPLP